jgi:hypothetical protein
LILRDSILERFDPWIFRMRKFVESVRDNLLACESPLARGLSPIGAYLSRISGSASGDTSSTSDEGSST